MVLSDRDYVWGFYNDLSTSEKEILEKRWQFLQDVSPYKLAGDNHKKITNFKKNKIN